MGIYSDALLGSGLLEEEEKPSPELVTDFLNEGRQIRLGSSLQQTYGVNPDEHAEALELSNKVNMPADFVRQDLPSHREQVKQDDIDYSSLLKNHPKLSKTLTDPDFAKVAADDIDVLKLIEDTAKLPFLTAKDFFLGDEESSSIPRRAIVDPAIAIAGKAPVALVESGIGVLDLMVGAFEFLDPTIQFGLRPKSYSVGQKAEELGLRTRETQKIMNQWLSPEAQLSAENVQKAEGVVETLSAYAANPATLTQDALSSWTYLVGSIAAAQKVAAVGATRAQALLAAHATEGVMTAGAMNESLRAEGVDIDTARKYSAAAGTMTALIGYVAGIFGEKVGLGDAVESVLLTKTSTATPKTGIKQVAKEAAKGFVQEGLIEEGAQNVSEKIFENLATGRPVTEGLGTAYGQGVAVGGTVGGVINSTRQVIENIAADAEKLQTANRNREFMEAFGDNAKASKLRERAKPQFQQFIDEVMKDGPVENVHIPVDKFDEYFQTADMEEILAELPGVRGQLDQARERGGDIVIPINEYATKIAPTEHHAGLIEDIRFNPTELTIREAIEMQDRLPEIMEEYIADAQEIMDKSSSDQEALDQIHENVREQLIEAGDSPVIAAQQAILIPHMFKTIEARYGLDALQEFQRRGFIVQGAIPGVAKVTEDLDILIDRIRFGKVPTKEEIKATPALADIQAENQELLDFLAKNDIDFAKATNQEIKDAIRGVKKEVVEGIEYKQLEEITVKVKAIEAETGKEFEIDQQADEALNETNENIEILEEVIKCLGT